jgi:hypothetical protein
MHVSGGSYIIECSGQSELAQLRQDLDRQKRIVDLLQDDIISLDQHIERSQKALRKVIEVTEQTHKGKSRAYTALSRIESIAREALL